MSIPVTAVVSTRNEQVAIGRCLEGLRDFDEVVVVDSASDDDTQRIAREQGANVVNFRWNGHYPKKKQWILDNVETQSPWILFVDADESPTGELVDELRAFFHSQEPAETAACDIALQYHFMGRRLRHGHKVSKRCLVHRDRIAFPELDDLDAPGMGELEGHYQPVARGPVLRLTAELRHDDPDPLGTWVSRHNKYADWEAHLRVHADARLEIQRYRSRQGQLFDRVPGKPLIFFLYSYVVRRGFLDGRAGFDYAYALSFYYWLINAKTRELATAGAK